MKLAVGAVVIAGLLGFSVAQQCCDEKDVTGARDAALNGLYKLKSSEDGKPDPQCKDGCVYVKDDERYCFKAVPKSEAPEVDCKKKELAELNKEFQEVKEVGNVLEEIEAKLRGNRRKSAARMKRQVETPASCDEVVALTKALNSQISNQEWSRVIVTGQAVLDGLAALNNCEEKRAELLASVEESKSSVKEVEATIYKQLDASNKEAAEAGKSTVNVPTTTRGPTTPGAGGPTTTPGAGGPTTTPGAGGPTTTPGAGGPTTTPGAGGPTTTPGAGGPTTTPGAGVPTTTPGAGPGGR